MYTEEPSVILNLKKGGKVASKKASSGKTMKKAEGGASLMSALAGTPALVGRPAMNTPVAVPKKPSMASRRKAMMAPPPMKKGGHADAAEDRAMIKKAMSGKKFANGGGVTSMMTKTTVSSAMAKPYDETMMHTTPKGKTGGTTGEVKESNGGGYKRGGKVMRKSTGGAIPSDTNKDATKGSTRNGGTIAGNEGKYLETLVHTAGKGPSAYKRGGKVMQKNTGGIAESNAGGYATGGVANSNMGGYKKGGASKKHFATGGKVNSGRPVALFHGNVHSGPKTQNNLSGTYKDGGEVIPNKRLKMENNKKAADSVNDANVDSLYKYKQFPQSIKTAKSGDNRASKKVTPQYR
jgi:hypothetical protein